MKICIGGYAGCGNLGDDAILEGMIGALTRYGVPRTSVTVLTGRPRRDQKRFGVRCAGRMNLPEVLSALRGAEFFLCGGGTLIQNRTGNRSLAYYLSLLRLARACGCRTVCLGGVGPVEGRSARRRVARELNACEAILLRDVDSADLLREIGVFKPRIRVGADPAFLLSPPPPGRSAFLRKTLTGTANAPFFCVCAGDPTADESASLIRALSGSFSGMTPVFLASDLKKDVFRTHAPQIPSGAVAYVPRDVSELLALISASRFVVSRRLHPLILAALSSVPCLGIASDPKIPSFCHASHVPCLPDGASEQAIRSAIASLPRFPAPSAAPFREKAEKDLAILARMVYNNGKTMGKETLFFP